MKPSGALWETRAPRRKRGGGFILVGKGKPADFVGGLSGA